MEEDCNGIEYELRLRDGGPWGFRLAGGAEFGCPLQVAKVRVNSKSYYAGLEEGDILIKVNSTDISLTTHTNVMHVIEQAGENIVLTILRGVKSLDKLYRTFIETHHDKQQMDSSQNQRTGFSRVDITLNKEGSSGPILRVLRRSVSKERQLNEPRTTTLLTVPQPNDQAEYKTFVSSSEGRKPNEVAQKILFSRPPTSPKPNYIRASSMSRTADRPVDSITTSTLNLTVGGYNQQEARHIEPLHVDVRERASSQPPSGSAITFSRHGSGKAVVVPIKPFEIPPPKRDTVEFRVRTIDAPKEVWKPNTDYRSVNTNKVGEVMSYPPNPYTNVVATEEERQKRHDKPPANFYWELMENQPEHIPGYNNPLIVDDTQGDFGGNPIIYPEKRLYSDSSFYMTKDNLYPTVPEQMRLCKMISGILEAPDAMRSRGGKMYHKRKLRSGEWTKESVGKKYEPPYESGDADFYDERGFHHWPSTMKDNITDDELERLGHNTVNLSKHDLLPPVVAFDINSALKRSRNHGKGVEIFNRNKERAEQFTVDENNRQQSNFHNKLDSQVSQYEDYLKNYKSPWNAAWEGNLERAFATMDPCAARSCTDEPGLRKDENQHQLNYNHLDATFGIKYKEVAPVKPPRASAGLLRRNLSQSTSALDKTKNLLPEPRLARMITPREEEQTTYDTYTHKWCMPSYYGQDLLNASVDERMKKSQYGTAGWYRRPAEFLGHPHSGSLTDVTLRRPKDYIKTRHYEVDDDVFYGPTDSQYLGTSSLNLKRPKDYIDQQQQFSQLASLAAHNYSSVGQSDQNSRPMAAYAF